MTVRRPRYSKEEFARRGNEIYERQIRPQVEVGNRGKTVAIDIETGAYEMGDRRHCGSASQFVFGTLYGNGRGTDEPAYDIAL
jgi:hypothetical protein